MTAQSGWSRARFVVGPRPRRAAMGVVRHGSNAAHVDAVQGYLNHVQPMLPPGTAECPQRQGRRVSGKRWRGMYSITRQWHVAVGKVTRTAE